MKNEIRIVFTKDRLYDAVFIHDSMALTSHDKANAITGKEDIKRTLKELDSNIVKGLQENLIQIISHPGGLNYDPLIQFENAEMNWRIAEINITFETK